MEKFTKSIGAIALFVGAIFLILPLGTAAGALAGEIVGWLFGDTILFVLGKFGLHDVKMWQLGATVAFFGGFMRTSVVTRKD